MKCKICGHRTNSLPAMREHYQKKHPEAMKHKKSKLGETGKFKGKHELFCPHCGKTFWVHA